jgi:hypothetical protein
MENKTKKTFGKSLNLYPVYPAILLLKKQTKHCLNETVGQSKALETT